MIDRDDVYKEERLFHKPTEKKNTPKKANHKHHYEYCVFEIVKGRLRYDPSHGLIPMTELTIGTYCPVCGKIGDLLFGDELDPQTRTLPSFKIDDCFQKAVQLDENGTTYKKI